MNVYKELGIKPPVEPEEAFTYEREGDAHIMHTQGIRIEVSRLDVGKELHGWIRVTSTLPGTPPVLMTDQRSNLSGHTGRSTIARYLSDRCPEISDWPGIVEQICERLMGFLREGEPFVRMVDVQERDESPYRVQPLLRDRLPTVFYGDGGIGKSLLLYYIGILVHSGIETCDMNVEPGPVLLCDWEILDEVIVKRQLRLLARGLGIEQDEEMWNIHYRPCYAPLFQESEAISRYIQREGIVMTIVDSLGAACGGDKTSQEVVSRMFASMRTWRTTIAGIDHVAHDQQGKQSDHPFGSVYTVTNSRNVWRVRGTMDGDELHQGLFQTKTNFSRIQPMGFKFTFLPTQLAPDEVQVTREDLRDVPELRSSLGQQARIKIAIREARQSLTAQDISDATDIPLKSVKNNLTLMKAKGEVGHFVAVGTQSAGRWSLVSKQEQN